MNKPLIYKFDESRYLANIHSNHECYTWSETMIQNWEIYFSEEQNHGPEVAFNGTDLVKPYYAIKKEKFS